MTRIRNSRCLTSHVHKENEMPLNLLHRFVCLNRSVINQREFSPILRVEHQMSGLRGGAFY
jgi:hypothetical protein